LNLLQLNQMYDTCICFINKLFINQVFYSK